MLLKYKRYLWLLLPIAGIIAGYLLLARPVTMTIDGVEQTIISPAFMVRGVLRNAGIRVSPQDEVTPAIGKWVDRNTKIVFNHAGLVHVWVEPEGQLVPVNTPAKTPLEIVTAAGFRPGENDEYRVNGLLVLAGAPLEKHTGMVLQYSPAVMISVIAGGETLAVFTAASTIGDALFEAGVTVFNGDSVLPSLTTRPENGMEVVITRGKSLEISVDGQVFEVNSNARTVGEALVLAGVALQDMDYSKPAESDPLPEDGKIEVIRVSEEILLEQSTIPFTVEYVADDSLELDQTSVKVEGSYGLQAKRIRVRYENGEEVKRTDEGTVVLKEPVARQVAYGTQIVLRTLNTPEGTITYYRALTVTATSYSPCNSAADRCYPITASGKPVQKGVIAVRLAWYQILKGTKMYVPGYGIGSVEDTGYYPYNPNWIDLGFTDAEFALYGKFYPSITVYLLAPAPAYVPGVMP
jgi:resuscitation-promoting factor RpfB